jgi:hypothetical protein
MHHHKRQAGTIDGVNDNGPRQVPSVDNDRLERLPMISQTWIGKDDGPPGHPTLQDGDRPVSW